MGDNEEELLNFIELFCGEVCRGVFNQLISSGRELVDEELASKLGMNVNDVRKALYELQSLGVVSYKRVREETEGKFIYYWRADVDHINQLLLQRKKAVLRKLEDRLRMEEGTSFYMCPVDGFRMSFDEALENDFRCPKCGSGLEYVDNSVIKDKLRKLINKLREEIMSEEKTISG